MSYDRTFLLLLAASVIALPSCLSSKTKETLMIPAVAKAWPAVRADIERGIDASIKSLAFTDPSEINHLNEQIQILDTSFKNNDLDALEGVKWMELAPYAEKGIQDRIQQGEISEGVAASLRERILRFSHVMGMLQSTVYLPHSGNRTYWVDVPGVQGSIYAGTNRNLALGIR